MPPQKIGRARVERNRAIHGEKDMRKTNIELLKQVEALERILVGKQSRIDELMFEYCLNNMTAEQLAKLESHPRPTASEFPPDQSAPIEVADSIPTWQEMAASDGVEVLESSTASFYMNKELTLHRASRRLPMCRQTVSSSVVEKLIRIIAYAYQVCGALDADKRILDVLSNPAAATDEQISEMLPYISPRGASVPG